MERFNCSFFLFQLLKPCVEQLSARPSYLDDGESGSFDSASPDCWRHQIGHNASSDTNCEVPDDCIDPRRRALFVSRDVMRGLIDELRSELT